MRHDQTGLQYAKDFFLLTDRYYSFSLILNYVRSFKKSTFNIIDFFFYF